MSKELAKEEPELHLNGPFGPSSLLSGYESRLAPIWFHLHESSHVAQRAHKKCSQKTAQKLKCAHRAKTEDSSRCRERGKFSLVNEPRQ